MIEVLADVHFVYLRYHFLFQKLKNTKKYENLQTQIFH